VLWHGTDFLRLSIQPVLVPSALGLLRIMIREMYIPLKKVLKKQLFHLQVMQEATDQKRFICGLLELSTS
jgi:hypothetical protein